MMKKTLIALLAVGIALSATACNTVKGAGKDLGSASDSTKDAMHK